MSMGDDRDRIVITGMGLVTPLGRSLEQVWSRVQGGQSGVARWNGEWNGALSGWPVALSGKFQEDSHRSARFAVDAAQDALAQAGMGGVPDPELAHRGGVCVGNSKGNLLALEKAMRQGVDANTMEDFFHGSINNAIMRATGICGPSLCLVSACATGAHSIVQGARWIMDDQADFVLAGASESSLTPLVLHGFRRMGVLADVSPGEDPCTVLRPYDSERKGFILGEGAGVVLLERLGSARARGATIQAELTGWGLSGDGYKPVSFDPSGDAIVRAAEACLRRARVEMMAMDYINCHGTGTRENDTIESRALKRLLKGAQTGPALSSTKPMTGHLLGAGASVALILAVVAMQHEFVPPTINLTDPDPECDLDFTAGEGRPRRIRNAMSLSYGFGGHVAALAVGKVEG